MCQQLSSYSVTHFFNVMFTDREPKVMFSQACVIHSVHGVGCIPACTRAGTAWEDGEGVGSGVYTTTPETATDVVGIQRSGMHSCMLICY